MNRIVMIFACLLMALSTAFAQPGNCVIEVGDFCTRTQGGWGAPCSGGNAGCLLQNNFTTVFPSGLTVGTGNTIHFSSSTAVRDFLPAGSTPDVLTQDYVNPLSTSAGVFAGQVTALAINVAFGDAGIGGFADLGDLEVDMGPFDGYTVDQILALAYAVLGGDLSGLPLGTTVSDLNMIVDCINQNFDNCNTNWGVLVLPGCGTDQPCPPMPPIWVEIGSSFCLDYCGEPIIVYWCCPFDGQPVFHLENCAGGTMPGGITWVASYDSSGLECQAPGGYWHAVFEAEEDGCFCVFFERQLAVEMAGFSAIANNGMIGLSWATASENGNDHFEVFRNEVKVASIQGIGTSNSRTEYSWIDRDVTAGQLYTYELITEDVNGIRRSHGTRTVEAGSVNRGIVTEYALHQNYPNPFNPSTTISFDVPEASNVALTVTNALGVEVARLVNGRVEAGSHTVQFDANNLPSGLYFYVLKSGAFSSTQKMLLLK